MSDERAAVARILRAIELTLEPLADERVPDGAVWAGSAVYWICALDEVLGKPPYADDAARLILGLRFARDAITHGGQAATTEEGLAYPLSFPLDFGPLVWASPGIILAHWTPRASAASVASKQAAYADRVAGRRLGDPLREAALALRAETTRRHGLP